MKLKGLPEALLAVDAAISQIYHEQQILSLRGHPDACLVTGILENLVPQALQRIKISAQHMHDRWCTPQHACLCLTFRVCPALSTKWATRATKKGIRYCKLLIYVLWPAPQQCSSLDHDFLE